MLINLKIDHFRKIHLPGLKKFCEQTKKRLKTPNKQVQEYTSANHMNLIINWHFYAEIYGVTDEIRSIVDRLKKFQSVKKIISEVDLGL